MDITCCVTKAELVKILKILIKSSLAAGVNVELKDILLLNIMYEISM